MADLSQPTGLGYSPSNLDLASQLQEIERQRQLMSGLLLGSIVAPQQQVGGGMFGPVAVRRSPLEWAARAATAGMANSDLSDLAAQQQGLAQSQAQKAGQALSDLGAASGAVGGSPMTVQGVSSGLPPEEGLPSPTNPAGQMPLPAEVTSAGSAPHMDLPGFAQAYARAQYAGVDPHMLDYMGNQFMMNRMLAMDPRTAAMVPGMAQGGPTMTPAGQFGASVSMPVQPPGMGGAAGAGGNAGAEPPPGTMAYLLTQGPQGMAEYAKIRAQYNAPQKLGPGETLVQPGQPPTWSTPDSQGGVVDWSSGVPVYRPLPGYAETHAGVKGAETAATLGVTPVPVPQSDGTTRLGVPEFDQNGKFAGSYRYVGQPPAAGAPQPQGQPPNNPPPGAVNLAQNPGAAAQTPIPPSPFQASWTGPLTNGNQSVGGTPAQLSVGGRFTGPTAPPAQATQAAAAAAPQAAANAAQAAGVAPPPGTAPSGPPPPFPKPVAGPSAAGAGVTQSPAAKAEQEAIGKTYADQQTKIDVDAGAASQVLARNAQQQAMVGQFTPNAGTGVRQQVAEWAEAAGMDPATVTKIAQGSLPAIQAMGAASFNQAFSELSAATGGKGRMNLQTVLAEAKANPNPNMTPQAMQQLWNISNGVAQWQVDKERFKDIYVNGDPDGSITGKPQAGHGTWAGGEGQWNRDHPLASYLPSADQVRATLLPQGAKGAAPQAQPSAQPAAAPVPNAPAMPPGADQMARNPTTGETLYRINGQWVNPSAAHFSNALAQANSQFANAQ